MTKQRLKFYRGLLYGLRLKRDSFYVDVKFRKAFRETVEYASHLLPIGPGNLVPKIHIDPMFGTCYEAREMLLEGEQDLLLSFQGSRLQKACFQITRDQASQELEELMPHTANVFRTLGSFLADRLTK